jgi:UDPglucose 6-dehydrogenase
MTKLAVIGTGYVGLVSGVCLASKGHQVTCFDINSNNINKLDQGICPIYERGLDDLLASSKDNLSFRVLDDQSEAEIMNFDAVLVAVGTPTINGRSDLSQIASVGRMMGRLIKSSQKYISIILKSTVLPGTTDTFFKDIVEAESGKNIGDFGLGMNPEFLREGNAIEDFQHPDRIVFGFEDEKTLEILRLIYKPWDCEKIELNTRSAEMMKYVNNALLATLISTINEYSNIARVVENIDFEKVMHGVHLDNRWSPLDQQGLKVRPKIIDYLKPGCGYGGSCFPKDVMAISSLAKDFGASSSILSAVIEVNERQPEAILQILKKAVGDLHNKRVLVLGLAFKPDTDDVRESVSLKLLKLLSGHVNGLIAHDPIAIDNAKKEINQSYAVDFTQDWKNKIEDADVIIICTNWSEYSKLACMNDLLKGKVIFDTRSLLTKLDSTEIQYITVN